jgi:hypothetical protein
MPLTTGIVDNKQYRLLPASFNSDNIYSPIEMVDCFQMTKTNKSLPLIMISFPNCLCPCTCELSFAQIFDSRLGNWEVS